MNPRDHILELRHRVGQAIIGHELVIERLFIVLLTKGRAARTVRVLADWWKEHEFLPQQRAFYYIRVIQIPTPRWTADDAKRFGIKMNPNVPVTAQERAYTSPIRYTSSRSN